MKKEKRKIFKVKYTNYFVPKRYIITYTELRYYKDLLEISSSLDLILLTKVSIYNLIQLKDTFYKSIGKRQCGNQTIDFILSDKESCRMRLCIQLDDPYNKERQKIRRDKFINELFSELNIKMIRIKINEEYNKEHLENQIRQIVSQPVF